MNIFIGGAWPYANGSLHIGHLSALLGGDVLARYYRLKGDKVLYVSGSDCHGTPITLRAKKEGVEPGIISNRFHQEFSDCFNRLGFSYDHYGRTDSEDHKTFVKEFFQNLYSSGALYDKQTDQAYCPACSQFLPDRFVTGTCPECGKPARGDQCDNCGSLLDPSQLHERKCGICSQEPQFKPTRHLFISLSKYEDTIKEWVSKSEGWRSNAIGMTLRYLNEGLKDRAVTRDIDWGISVPVEGFENKKIYVWVEAVLGYLSASKKAAQDIGYSFEDFWHRLDGSLHYYIHGKDNIPFHSVILPGLLLAAGGYKLPDRIISSEYETLEGKKISTSGNWAVWVPYLLKKYDPDSIRFFFISNGPEKKDSDFSWNEFIQSHNTELVNQFGNLVNRSLVFLNKSYCLNVPSGTLDSEIESLIESTYHTCGKAIEYGNFRDALDKVLALVRFGNRYFDEQKPWITIKEDSDKCSQTLFNLVQVIVNLSVLFEPFIPFASKKLRELLNVTGTPKWEPAYIPSDASLNEPYILFNRLDKKLAEEELNKLISARQC
jgi:methionyl-tRNA synthetase